LKTPRSPAEAGLRREDELRTTLRAVADMREYPTVSRSAADKLATRLRDQVFTPRNRLAHGRVAPGAIAEDAARKAVACAQAIIWDWAPEVRGSMLVVNRDRALDELWDAD
jgi:hypothetical protein